MTVVLADIGSTFTKVRAYDTGGDLVWGDQVPTAAPDLGLRLGDLASSAGIDIRGRVPACSSAAGGLRIVALGLTQTFTREAARTAALGAGGRIVGDYSFPLTDTDVVDLEECAADVILLTGGSDGGDADAAVGFAEALAEVRRSLAVVVACNRQVARRCSETLTRAGHRAEVVDNIMPDVGTLNAEPVRAAVRRIFLDTVIGRVTGEKTRAFEVRQPTPAAVLGAARLLSHTDDRGALVVDVGGATTDVHSVLAPGQVATPSAGMRMAEQSTRTVEADLGMRESAEAAREAARRAGLDEPTGLDEHLAQRVRDVTLIDPRGQVDRWLATTCATLALQRHVGHLVLLPSVGGGVEAHAVGRDLRDAGRVVATGGVLSRDDGTTMAAALAGPPDLLLPRRAVVSTDANYELATIGVLASVDAALAAKAMTRLVRDWDAQI
ncbi:glutamate mutase L [Prauserella flavalba]|uniref:glutamate mutase L n=1 Tax=Prauserella flavalba TaxID=1477506 RepID=UPI0036E7DAF4